MKLFTQDVRVFFASKSNWTGVSTILVGLYLLQTGDIQLGIESIFAGLALVFVKDAIAKVGTQK